MQYNYQYTMTPSVVEIVSFVFVGATVLTLLCVVFSDKIQAVLHYGNKLRHKRTVKRYIRQRVKSQTDEGELCVICMDHFEYGPVLYLDCNHNFHDRCAYRWFKRCMDRSTALICPICRKEIELKPQSVV